jgi:hypothetical protein
MTTGRLGHQLRCLVLAVNKDEGKLNLTIAVAAIVILVGVLVMVFT